MRTFKQAFRKRAFTVIKGFFLCVAFLAFSVIMANLGLGLLKTIVVWLAFWLSLSVFGAYLEIIEESDGGW